MQKIFKYDQLGEANYGWLHPHYHFSFSHYYNPDKMGFAPLRVWNDDIIQPHSGFPPHPHENMEIITYIKEGAISHEDSMGNKGKTEAGQIQIMSAGTGIIHSEYNHEDVETKLFQIWIEPAIRDVKPRWETLTLSDSPPRDAVQLLASGREKDKDSAPIHIYQDAAFYVISVLKNESVVLPISIKRHGYGVVSKGQVTINDKPVNEGDGIYMSQENLPVLEGINNENEFIFVDIPLL